MQGPFDPMRILTAHYWGEIHEAMLWRPVTTFSFAVDHLIAGNAPWLPHLGNLLLHAAATLFWTALLRRLFRSDALAFATGALFAVHPLHTEAVTWVSGRAELLAAVFGIAAIHLALDPRAKVRWLAPVAVLFAVGSKESAATIPAVLLFSAWAFRRDRRVRFPVPVGLACFAPVILYVLARHAVLGAWGAPATDPMDNPLVRTSLAGRLPTVLDSAGRYLFLLVWPARLSVDYSAPVLGIVRGPTPFLALGLLALAGLIVLAVRRPARPEGWGSGFALLTFALASNLPVVIGTIFAERLFYLPSAGLLLVAVAGGLALLARRPQLRPAFVAALAILLIAGAARSFARNRDYQSDLTLYEAGARTQPKSPKMRYNLALELSRLERWPEALREATEAIRLNPASRESREVLAKSLEKMGRGSEAIDFLEGMLEQDPRDRQSRLILVRLLDEGGRPARAATNAQAGMREEPDHLPWVALVAKRRQDHGDYATAIPLWQRALAGSPESQDVPLHLGFCLLRVGRFAEARDAYAEAARRDPRSAAAANGLAWAILQ
ncbi:MAG: tetratricopeptide repeat protein, partial [Candidatus Eisenbacteria bacterium]|nr:tetratricopeptide repeat protein [Candidatus Eisenbacteria bacterium]